MKIESMHIGMTVRHPEYGAGTVKAIQELAVEVLFNDGRKTLHPEAGGLEPAEPQATLSGLELPLEQVIENTVSRLVQALDLSAPETEDIIVEQLGSRWNGGKMVLHPADPTLETKEVSLENFFHKIVMMRNNLRVLEQKINAHTGLSDGDKFELQQYITRCYGSMTTFNVLFRDKNDQFSTKK